MSDTKLNLGPLIVEAPGRVFVLPARNFKAVCEVDSTNRPYETAVAYAILFAAAPDLLDAMQHLLDAQNGPPLLGKRHEDFWNEAVAKAKAAIAKAEGHT